MTTFYNVIVGIGHALTATASKSAKQNNCCSYSLSFSRDAAGATEFDMQIDLPPIKKEKGVRGRDFDDFACRCNLPGIQFRPLQR